MPRADLSWLVSLLTKTPTVEANPTYSPDDTPEIAKQYGVDSANPYIAPSQWQRTVHENASNQIDALNNQFKSAADIAQLQDSISKGAAAENYDALPDYLKPKNPLTGQTLLPRNAIAAGYGKSGTTPTELGAYNTANNYLANGGADRDALARQQSVDAENRRLALAGMLNNPEKEAIDTSSRLTLGTAQNNAELPLVQPRADVARASLGNEYVRQTQNVPASLALERTQTGNQQTVADALAAGRPIIAGNTFQQLLNEAGNLRYSPTPASPYAVKYDMNDNGDIVENTVRDPRFIGLMNTMTAKMGTTGALGTPMGTTSTGARFIEPGSGSTVIRQGIGSGVSDHSSDKSGVNEGKNPSTVAPPPPAVDTPTVSKPSYSTIPGLRQPTTVTQPKSGRTTGLTPAQIKANRITELTNILKNANTSRGTFMTQQEYADKYSELQELLK